MTIATDQHDIEVFQRDSKPGSDSGGRYYRLSPTSGVKICGGDPQESRRRAAREFKLLSVAHRRCPGIFPKPFTLQRIRENHVLRWGIVMEHIEGRHHYGLYPSKVFAKITALQTRLLDAGIVWEDDHEDNILVKEDGSVRFIDISPGDYVSISGGPNGTY